MKHLSLKYTRWQLPWLSRLIGVAAAMLFCVLSAQAQRDWILEPIGGGGGDKFVGRCPQGQLLAGFELRTGDNVDSIRVICVAAYGPADAGPPVTGGERFGGDGGSRTEQLVCRREAAPIVIAMYVDWRGYDTPVVRKIHLFCGAAVVTQNPRQIPDATFDGRKADLSAKADVFGTATPYHGYDGRQHCPDEFAPVGINGRAGALLDAVGLICGALKLTPKPPPPPPKPEPEPVKALGRVKLPPGTTPGPSLSICEYAREARTRNSPAAPGLEEKCRAAGAAGEIPPKAPVKAIGRVKVPPGTTPTGPPVSICEYAREARARNSPAAPGLEAKCRAAGAAGETPPAIAADTNPVLVPNGQDSGTTTISWKAGPDYTYCEIYLSVDNGEWSEFATGPDGAKPATIKLGSSYTFRMMVYEGQEGTPKIVATRTVTAAKN